ncbi:hypothetical protein JTE90_022326 [Oedothorax gibbosus]|uniref:Integrase catalytic domain-containing protein n=1 Tax=Oedothorax gibbosus TaxID=931172 RepID=A0AAV6VYB8_9ARAC|nr:hypothetical protein JTE90_022326 [Oedothorax gibbosus]
MVRKSNGEYRVCGDFRKLNSITEPDRYPIRHIHDFALELEALHDLAHPGVKASTKLLRERFVWKEMGIDIAELCKACLECQKNKIHRHTKSAIGDYPLPSCRFSHINVDVVGPLPTSCGFSYVLTCVDRFSRWPEAFPMVDQTAATIAETFFAGWISRFGVPECISTDQDRSFESDLCHALMKFLGTEKLRTTAYNPASNGLVERFYRQLKQAIRCQATDKWVQVKNKSRTVDRQLIGNLTHKKKNAKQPDGFFLSKNPKIVDSAIVVHLDIHKLFRERKLPGMSLKREPNFSKVMEPQAELMLFVKAGDDGKRYGACPFCQRLFMILFIKSSQGLLQFKVATVNFAKPPEMFKKLTLSRVPAMVYGDTALDNVDEIIQYLDDQFPTPSLDYDDADADKCCRDVFQKFCFYIKDVSKDASQLEAELTRIDDVLGSKTSRFLCGDQMTHLDCELLPKIHHIRIAAKALKGFEISPKLKNLWMYLERAYSDDVFKQTCPADQEIIVHWAEKPETKNLTMEEKARLSRELPKFSFEVPPLKI